MKKMKNVTSRFVMYALIALIAIGGTTSCKSKKKIEREQAAAEYAAKVDQAKKDLMAIINDETDWTLEEKQARIDAIKAENIDDPEIKDLIVKAEEKLKEEARLLEEERLKKEEEALRKKEAEKYDIINKNLNAIASSPNYDAANAAIENALQYFATPDIPVLIIISKAGGFNDYDKPTTISKFLNYLKDVKSYNYAVESAKYDEQGKITELELIKK
jgi:proteasome lid subunit RPN8/RPN11